MRKVILMMFVMLVFFVANVSNVALSKEPSTEQLSTEQLSTELTKGPTKSQRADDTSQQILYTPNPIQIDGDPQDPQWNTVHWQPIDQIILGSEPSPSDFSGKFKLLWDEQYIYLLANIVDDVLYDRHPNPLQNYWDDDCLEVFIDENASGGDHLNNFNAFAYHIGLDNQVTDIVPAGNGKGKPALLNDHIKSVWRRSLDANHSVYWELAITVHNDKFSLFNSENTLSKESLHSGKNIGFMLAYCDNDGSDVREHFVGSKAIEPIQSDRNLGYKTADVFERYRLVKGLDESLDKKD
ncbi:sugar-binding protein [Colwellia sp. MEBiC06753]